MAVRMMISVRKTPFLCHSRANTKLLKHKAVTEQYLLS